MIDHRLTKQIQNWLESPKESRNLEEGAMLLLRLTGNRILFQNISRRPEKYADYMERELQKRFNYRVKQVTHEQVDAMSAQVAQIASQHLTLQESNPASEFQAGKRADHDQLPAEIQAAYVENKHIVQRMRAVHAELRVMTLREGMCPDSDRYPYLKELIELDKKLHENWATYDGYNIAKGEVITREDARAESRKACGFINLNKKRYAQHPTESLKKRLAEAYAKVVNPTQKMTDELRNLDVIK